MVSQGKQNYLIKNLLIVGGGTAGKLFIKDAQKKNDCQIIGVIDDKIQIASEISSGIKVLGKIIDLPKILEIYKIDRIIIAIPSERGDLIRKIVLSLYNYPNQLDIYLIPRTSEIILGGKVSYEDAREISLTDLVGENIIKNDQLKINKSLKDKNILISGGGGSIGSELSKQIFLSIPQKIVIIDNSEKNLFYVESELQRLKEINNSTKIKIILGDIKNKLLLEEIFSKEHIDTVFHAAAYKHVPILEDNPYEAATNNILGTYNICLCAKNFKVQKLILISTDKAVKPINIMGKTKRIAELIMMYFNDTFKTNFSAVRFGNVFNSSGSAVKIFINQIENNLPILITDQKMSRFFITIPEAVHLILQAWYYSKKNQIYMLEMGESVNILDLAKCIATIKKSNTKTIIKTIGIRKGEKINETLYDENFEKKTRTSHKKIFSLTTTKKINYQKLEKQISQLFELLQKKELQNHSVKGNNILKKYLNKILA